jgi:hypothetical protein
MFIVDGQGRLVLVHRPHPMENRNGDHNPYILSSGLGATVQDEYCRIEDRLHFLRLAHLWDLRLVCTMLE